MKKLTAEWQKSTRSDNSGPYCVEVRLSGGDVQLRDSKNPDGPTLTYTRAEWDAFTGGVRNGDFVFD